MPLFREPKEALDAIYELLNTHKGTLGLGYVGYADETLLPEYPAAVISFNSPVDRELGPTGTFDLYFSVDIVLYHAALDTNHKTRTRQDMDLAAAVREKLHEDYKMGGGVIFGYVQEERPGIMADDRGNANVATALLWTGRSRAPIHT